MPKRIIILIILLLSCLFLVGCASNEAKSGPTRSLADYYMEKRVGDAIFLDETTDLKAGTSVFRYTKNFGGMYLNQVATYSISFIYVDKKTGWSHTDSSLTGTVREWDIEGLYQTTCTSTISTDNFSMVLSNTNGENVDVQFYNDDTREVLLTQTVSLLNNPAFSINTGNNTFEVFIEADRIYIKPVNYYAGVSDFERK